MESPESDTFIDGKRTEKSLSLLTRKFVSLLFSSKNGLLDLKSVSIHDFSQQNRINRMHSIKLELKSVIFTMRNCESM